MDGPHGLMAFYADFEEPVVEDFRRWHNCEHMAERVAIPGFQRGRRYRGLDNPETFLMTYETDAAAVLGSKPYHAALNAPTPSTKKALTWFKNPARAIYTKTMEMGRVDWWPAPFLLTLRFNAPDAKPVHPLLESAAQDAIRVRFFEVDEEISGIMTAERKIYSGGPGNQQFLAFIERMEPFETAAALPDEAALSSAGATDIYVDRFTIDFALEAADD